MITGRVISINSVRRLIDVAAEDSNITVKGMYVPQSLILPEKGGIIYGDNDRKIVLEILRVSSTPDIPYENDLRTAKPGEFLLRAGTHGIIGMMKKLGSFIGSGPDNMLVFSGMAKSLEILTQNITASGNGYSFLLESPAAGPGRALLNLKVGALNISINPETSTLTCVYGLLTCTVTPSVITVKLLNTETKKQITLLSWSGNENSSELKTSIDNLTARLKDISITGKSLVLDVSGPGTVSADILKLVASRSLSVLGQSIRLAGQKIEMDAGSVVLNTGNSPKAGDFQVNNGPLSWFRINNKNEAKLYAFKSISFNGDIDNLASGMNTVNALTQINIAVNTLAAFIGVLPGGQAAAGPAVANLTSATAFTQMIKIKHLKCGPFAAPVPMK